MESQLSIWPVSSIGNCGVLESGIVDLGSSVDDGEAVVVQYSGKKTITTASDGTLIVVLELLYSSNNITNM